MNEWHVVFRLYTAAIQRMNHCAIRGKNLHAKYHCAMGGAYQNTDFKGLTYAYNEKIE